MKWLNLSLKPKLTLLVGSVIGILLPFHEKLHTILRCRALLNDLLESVLHDTDEQTEDDEYEERDEHVEVDFAEPDDYWVICAVVHQHVCVEHVVT